MKTTMKQLAAGTFLALLLMVTNVYAEGKEAPNASSREFVETTMELESWMIDDNIWNESSSFANAEETEESLNLEYWMINDENWENVESMSIETETEIDLGLENWMTITMVFNR